MKCVCGKETSNPVYCSRSCAVRENNKISPKRKPQIDLNWTCQNCGIGKRATHKQSIRKYCSVQCQQDFQRNEQVLKWLRCGEEIGSRTIKWYLGKTYGERCSNCSVSEWNGVPVVLELEHKDGNSENNHIENVCLLCPNCHAQTSTYKNKNKGRGRHYRRVRYQQGKSY
jgi:hypothetical protein